MDSGRPGLGGWGRPWHAGAMGPAPAILAQGKLQDLRELVRFLCARGVDARLVQPPEGQGGG